MSGLASKTVSHASIYALGNILRHITSFIMLPVYTRFLTPEDYGVLELLSMMIDFFGIIFGIRIGEAIFRYYFDQEDEQYRRRVMSTSILIGLLFSSCGVTLILLCSGFISEFLFGGPEFRTMVVLFSFTLVLDMLVTIGLTYVRAKQKPWLFIGISFTKLMLQLGFNVYFVVILGMHVEGVIYSALIAGSVISIILMGYALKEVGFAFSYPLAQKIAVFSYPIILAGIGSFYLTFGDRYFIRLFSGLHEVGLYSLGYKFGFVLVMLSWDPFNKIWDSIKYEIRSRENSTQIYQRLFIYISFVMIFVALLISLFVKELLIIMSDPVFWEAYKVVPLIMVAYLFQSWSAFCNLGILIRRNTIQITYGTMAGVVVITAAYLLLIPKFGAMGAAWATIIGFFVRFLWIYLKAKQELDMGLSWPRVSMIGAAAILTYLASTLFSFGLISSIALKSGLVVCFLAVCLWLPILAENDRKTILKILRNPLRAKAIIAPG